MFRMSEVPLYGIQSVRGLSPGPAQSYRGASLIKNCPTSMTTVRPQAWTYCTWGTSLTRRRTHLGTYRRCMPGVQGGS